MKTSVLGLICCAVLVATVWGQAVHKKLPGSEPYTPTKLEWLAVRLNANQLFLTTSKFSLTYTADHKTDTIRIMVLYHGSVDREMLNSTVDTAKTFATEVAKSYGWDKWVKIKADVARFDQ